MNFFIEYQNFNVYIKRSTPFLVPILTAYFLDFLFEMYPDTTKNFEGRIADF